MDDIYRKVQPFYILLDFQANNQYLLCLFLDFEMDG